MPRGDNTRPRSITMRNPEVDPVGAIRDIQRYLNTIPDTFGVTADLTRRLGNYPSEAFQATDSAVLYFWNGDTWVAGSAQRINAQTGTTYTFVIGDFNALVTGGNAGATTFTVPPFASVAFPPGTHIDLIQVGAGKLTIAQGAGVTILSQSSNKSLGAQYAAATLVASPTVNTWYLAGNLIA